MLNYLSNFVNLDHIIFDIDQPIETKFLNPSLAFLAILPNLKAISIGNIQEDDKNHWINGLLFNLSLERIDVSFQSQTSFFQFLSLATRSKHLVKLILNCGFKNLHFDAMCRLLMNNKNLRSIALHLDEGIIPDKAIEMIAETLKTTNIIEFDCSNDEFDLIENVISFNQIQLEIQEHFCYLPTMKGNLNFRFRDSPKRKIIGIDENNKKKKF